MTTTTTQLAGIHLREGMVTQDRTSVSASAGAVSRVIIGLVALPVGALLAAFGAGVWLSWTGVLFAVAAGTVLAVADWSFHYANHIARDAWGVTAAKINNLYYLVPVGTVFLFVWFAESSIERVWLLVAGVAVVLLANITSVAMRNGRSRSRSLSGVGR